MSLDGSCSRLSGRKKSNKEEVSQSREPSAETEDTLELVLRCELSRLDEEERREESVSPLPAPGVNSSGDRGGMACARYWP